MWLARYIHSIDECSHCCPKRLRTYTLIYVMFTSCNDILYIVYYYILMLVGALMAV